MIRRIFVQLFFMIAGFTSLMAQDIYVGSFTFGGDFLPAVKVITLPDPGYLVAELDSVSKSQGIQVRFADSLTGRSDINESRIDFPGNVTLTIENRYRSAYTGQVNLKIRFYPIYDLLEPNDKLEQAVHISPYTWYSINLFPRSDLDHFLIELKKDNWINPDARTESRNIRWELLKENGESLSNQFPFFTPAGKYIVRISSADNPAVIEPVIFRIVLLPELDQLEPNNESFVEIEKNKLYTVSLGSVSDIDKFFIKPTASGYLSIQSAQAPQQSVQFACTVNGKKFKGNPLIISVTKSETVNITMTPSGNYYSRPFFMIVKESPLLDPAEPNDSLAAAISINKSKGVYFSVFPSGDEDWFRVKTNGPGRIILNVYDALASETDIRNIIQTDLYDPDKNHLKMSSRNTNFGIIYASEFLRQAGNWYIRMTSYEKEETERLLAMRVYGPTVTGDASDGDSFDDIYFIGFELDTSSNNMLAALSQSSNSSFFMVDSSGSLEDVLSNVFKDAKKRKGSMLWWILGVGLVIALAGLQWYRKKRKIK